MNDQLPSTRKPFGKGLHMLSGVEDMTKGYVLLAEKIAHLKTSILQAVNTQEVHRLLKSFLTELASMQGIHAFYKTASAYMLRYVEEHFKEAIINASLDELRLKNTGAIPDTFIGKFCIWLYEEQGGKGLGALTFDANGNLINPNASSAGSQIFQYATTTPTTAPVVDNKQNTTSSSSNAWDTWGKSLTDSLFGVLNTGINATGNIMTGVANLNSAKALQTQADAQRQSLLQQQQQFEQTLAAQKEAQNAGNNAQVQALQQQLQQQQQNLALSAQQMQTYQSSLESIISKAQNSGINSSDLTALKNIYSNMQSDSTANKIMQTYTQPQYQAMLPQASSTNWGKIALYGGIALVVLLGGIYIATRGNKKGLRGVEEDTGDTATKGLAGATKKKTYKDKKYRDLGLRGIDLKGVSVS